MSLEQPEIGGCVKGRYWYLVSGVIFVLICGLDGGLWAKPSTRQIPHLTIPILGVSLNKQREPVGRVSNIIIDIYKRQDQNGLQIQFHTEPGKFSLLARKSVHQAIVSSLRRANLSGKSLTILLGFPYPGMTMYGESLSAMVGLSVVAMLKGDQVLEGRTLTGTVTDHGAIGPVSGIQLKLLAAYHHNFQRVFVPSAYDEQDGDWRTPFLMHVSPVSTIDEAYRGLTGHQLRAGP